MKITGIALSVFAGTCAAAAGLMMKMAATVGLSNNLFYAYVAGAILANIFMWQCFVFSLQGKESTIVPMVLNNAANFGMSAVFGVVFFNETRSFLSIAGVGLMCTGAVLLIKDMSAPAPAAVPKHDQVKQEDKKDL